MRPEAIDLTTLAMTGWWTAAARACESARPGRLFNDAWAAMLAGQAAVAEYDRTAGRLATHDLHAVVTRYFDEFLLDRTWAGLRQVVVLAAGLDTRAFRLPWPDGTRLFELDQPHVVEYKDCMFALHHVMPRCERRTMGVDLNGPWVDRLCAGGFRADEPTVWLLEQCCYFFDRAAVHALLEAIAAHSAGNSCLAFDIVNPQMVSAPETRQWSDRMADAGAPWLFTSEEPELLLAPFGWSATVLEPGETPYGRHPYPVRPRASRETPRLFLLTGSNALSVTASG